MVWRLPGGGLAQSLELRGLGPRGNDLGVVGEPQGSWAWAVAGTARAWIRGKRSRGGRRIPGVAGRGQALDLPELGTYGNEHGAVGKSQGAWAWSSRRNCQGSDGRRSRPPRTRIGYDEEWGDGLTVPRSERSPMHRECETLGRPDQVQQATRTSLGCSRRAREPFEAPFEPPLEPPRALRAMMHPKH